MILSVVTKMKYLRTECDDPQYTANTATVFQIQEIEHFVWFR